MTGLDLTKQYCDDYQKLLTELEQLRQHARSSSPDELTDATEQVAELEAHLATCRDEVAKTNGQLADAYAELIREREKNQHQSGQMQSLEEELTKARRQAAPAPPPVAPPAVEPGNRAKQPGDGGNDSRLFELEKAVNKLSAQLQDARKKLNDTQSENLGFSAQCMQLMQDNRKLTDQLQRLRNGR